jgi:hypothetical protein
MPKASANGSATTAVVRPPKTSPLKFLSDNLCKAIGYATSYLAQPIMFISERKPLNILE